MRKLKMSELKRLDIEQFKKANKTPLVIVLDNIRSLNNIGSIFRTADAFLLRRYIYVVLRLHLRIRISIRQHLALLRVLTGNIEKMHLN